jgi:hypothetical protein
MFAVKIQGRPPAVPPNSLETHGRGWAQGHALLSFSWCTTLTGKLEGKCHLPSLHITAVMCSCAVPVKPLAISLWLMDSLDRPDFPSQLLLWTW